MRRRSTLLLSAIFVMGALLAPALAPASAKRADARLDRELQALAAMPEGPPGVSALIQREGKLKLHTAGVAQLGSPSPIALHQRMRIASVTKAFTGAVVLRLVEKRRLGLRTTIGQLRPDMPAAWHPVTVRQLLYHTSGLPDVNETPGFGQAFSSNPKGYISPQQLIDFAATAPVEFPPGARYDYSNTDNIVLGLLAERATGVPFAELLSRLIFRPLRLTETTFPDQVPLPTPFVHGYLFDEPGQPPEDVSEELSPSGAWAAGAIVSSARDLNRFIRAWNKGLLQTRRVERAQRAFLPPFTGGEPPGPGQNRAGLTLYRYKTPCGVVFGHSGNIPGYTQLVAATGDGRRSLVVTATEALNRPATGPQDVFAQLQHLYGAAACAALAK